METSKSQLPRSANDSAVSPVVGTILMVAVTVAIGATVLAIMNGLGDGNVQESSNAVFKAASVDTDSDGKTDTIKLTYVSGPQNLTASDVRVSLPAGTVCTLTKTATNWFPGDFTVCGPGAGNYILTVSVVGTTVFDQTITIDE